MGDWILGWDSFPARWHCGNWDAGLGWLHITADLIVFVAYVAIPLALLSLIRSTVTLLRSRGVSGLTMLRSVGGTMAQPALTWAGAFVLSCGIGHALEPILFWVPIYRVTAAWKGLTAIISVGAAAALWAVAYQMRVLVRGIA